MSNDPEPLPQPAQEIPLAELPLSIDVNHQPGHVFMTFTRPVQVVRMTPKLARRVIRLLSQHALAADRSKPGH